MHLKIWYLEKTCYVVRAVIHITRSFFLEENSVRTQFYIKHSKENVKNTQNHTQKYSITLHEIYNNNLTLPTYAMGVILLVSWFILLQDIQRVLDKKQKTENV